jgi:glucosamine-6-phosphate deaminase
MLSKKTNTGVTTFSIEKLSVSIFATREEMGKYAGKEVVSKIRELLEGKAEINMIFAAAPSQEEFIEYLIKNPTVEWKRINAFHMDEYIGLENDASQGFGSHLKKQLFSKVPFKSVYYINGQVSDTEAECERYTQLLKLFPVDIVCLGIGENGHLAFNDPHVADFHDKQLVKVVNLELVSRQQQVNESCFSRLHLVPTKAITLTIPALMRAPWVFCLAPASNKAQAVYRTLNNDINEKCPASILRTKENAKLYLDEKSASLLEI